MSHEVRPTLQQPVLEICGLKLDFETRRGALHALDGVDMSIYAGETLGLVGETGCGKSVTALSILRAIPSPPARIVAGSITYRGQDLLTLPMSDMRRIRGDKIAMVFQDPATALNPVFTVGHQLIDVIRQHETEHGRSRVWARNRALELLDMVKLADPEAVLRAYPHSLSGGMKQRVMIAMALSCNPDLLIADEPTTALDVTIQAQILRLMGELQDQINSAVLLITHDLGIVAQVCQRIVVMYAGVVVESGSVHAIYHHPLHPYTRGLLDALPDRSGKRGALRVIPGSVPDIAEPPLGCRFAPRCEFATDACRLEKPVPITLDDGHTVSCTLNLTQQPTPEKKST